MGRAVYKAQQPYATNSDGKLIVDAHTDKDITGKWIVRAESKIAGYEVVFAGSGDEIGGTMEIGGGPEFRFDFETDTQLVPAPEGFRRARIDWQFNDKVYIKEGTIYFFNMPKGSYVDMTLVCPVGCSYGYRVHGRPESRSAEVLFATATEEVVVSHWINHNLMEGSAPMGDEFNTESAGEASPPTYLIWRAEITIPEISNWRECHGHWTLELYRPSSVYFPEP